MIAALLLEYSISQGRVKEADGLQALGVNWRLISREECMTAGTASNVSDRFCSPLLKEDNIKTRV